jgi:2-amino-4-hydroxy-6-hydroxymethyldihydropteridine diphosphokinase
LCLALELLGRSDIRVMAVSSVYETEPVGYSRQPWFLNMVCHANTGLAPEALLGAVKAVEKELGRVTSFPNAPRVIDIDILLYGNLVLAGPGLIVPHPRIAERAFVLAPLAELAPELRHPVLGLTIGELLGAARGQEMVRPFGQLSLGEASSC